MIIVILLVIGLFAIWWNVVRDDRPQDWDTLVVTELTARELQAALLDLTRLIAAEHARALYIKSRQLVSEDAYGNRDPSRYYEEILYFIRNVVGVDERFLDLVRTNPALADPFVTSVAGLGRGTLQKKMGNEIVEFIDCYPQLTKMIELDWEATNPLEFEILCAQNMENAGWDAQLTKGSGDQGADVICRKDGISIVLQCKLYSSPIGNKAVQEAFAARSYYDLGHAAVVSNQPYTKSAKELATMTGVLLLHFHDLDGVDTLIAGEAS
ncbi:restriction endonuclease [Sphingomonadaceae bacterium G21617-S1]|nr:restriction endonuclease [Sphingomonadaceae bacterium G21617-S1]